MLSTMRCLHVVSGLWSEKQNIQNPIREGCMFTQDTKLEISPAMSDPDSMIFITKTK